MLFQFSFLTCVFVATFGYNLFSDYFLVIFSLSHFLFLISYFFFEKPYNSVFDSYRRLDNWTNCLRFVSFFH